MGTHFVLVPKLEPSWHAYSLVLYFVFLTGCFCLAVWISNKPRISNISFCQVFGKILEELIRCG